MPKMVINQTRFRWKTEPWRDPQNITAIWLYCQDGILSFEWELEPNVDLPKNKGAPARGSKHLDEDNYIAVKDPKVISTIGKQVKNITIIGARGKGVMLGNVEIPIGTQIKSIPLMSTLEDWDHWLNYLQRGLPSL